MGRWKKDITLTPAQIAYRENILKKKSVAKNKDINEVDFPSIEKKDRFVSDKLTYMWNCVYWVEEYTEGRVDVEKLKSVLNSLEQHCIDIRKRLENK